MAIILGLTGEKLGGKDTVAHYLRDHYSATMAVYSDILMNILGILDLPKSRRNTIQLAPALRAAFGGDVLARAIAKHIKSSSAEIIVLSGMRDLGEVPWIRNLGGKILYITAPFEIRYQRFMARREKDDDGIQSRQEFSEQEQALTEVQIPHIGAQADYKIENTGTLEELQTKIDAIMNELESA
jgi:dephospho-CoA kinase